MSIQVGERIPAITLMHMTDNGPAPLSTTDFFKGRRAVLFGLPGAFTPTCSARHLPGYVDNAAAIRAKGIEVIACISVNDAFVMDAWAKTENVDGKVVMLADGNGDFAVAVGLDEDRRDRVMGLRSQRFAMLVNDGVVEALQVEEPGAFEVSSAEAVLALL